MANIFSVQRTAFGNATLPTNNSANTASTLSVNAGVYIPAGAIITDVRVHAGDALTNASNLKNATVNVYVGTQVLGSNNNIASAKIVQTVPGQIGLASTAGILVPTAGNVVVHFASSDSARTGVVLDADVYVEYLYCAERDDA